MLVLIAVQGNEVLCVVYEPLVEAFKYEAYACGIVAAHSPKMKDYLYLLSPALAFKLGVCNGLCLYVVVHNNVVVVRVDGTAGRRIVGPAVVKHYHSA